MLKITRSANGEVIFTVSGRMDAENLAELEMLFGSEANGLRITLDRGGSRRYQFSRALRSGQHSAKELSSIYPGVDYERTRRELAVHLDKK
jgi:hypothetical protein